MLFLLAALALQPAQSPTEVTITLVRWPFT
jgi:hypothetical protein